MTKRIVVAVTSERSISLLKGFPEVLVQDGWEVHLVASPGPRLLSYGAVHGVDVHPLPMAREPSLVSDLTALLRWIRLLHSIRPQVLTVGTPKASLLGMLAAAAMRVPVRQYLVRGLRLETASGARRFLLQSAEMATILASNDVVAISGSLRAKLNSLWLLSKRPIAVVGEGSSNGIDLQQFNPELYSKNAQKSLKQEMGLKCGVPVIGYVGRLAADKGVGEMLECLHILRERGIDAQALLVGPTDEPEIQEKMSLAIQAGHKVVSAGTQLDVAKYYAVMDVFCMPSRREGFGNAALEASAMCVPVVATEATGLKDAVKDGLTGLLSPVGDVPALADNVSKVLADPEMRRRLGTAGRARIQKDFDRSVVQRRYADRLEDLRRGNL